ncbi:hypothetical protein I552_2648 [Mycobacterium xenopi 3993]|nr:hypothetical protein I552_2648 [Mycobacterium xenopi 3993]
MSADGAVGRLLAARRRDQRCLADRRVTQREFVGDEVIGQLTGSETSRGCTPSGALGLAATVVDASGMAATVLAVEAAAGVAGGVGGGYSWPVPAWSCPGQAARCGVSSGHSRQGSPSETRVHDYGSRCSLPSIT